MAFAGDLTFNPLTDSLTGSDGKPFKFSDPSGFELPQRGYDPGENTFQAPPDDPASINVAIDPKSTRLQKLEPFQPWDGKTPTDLPILIKVKGKCSKWMCDSCFLNFTDSPPNSNGPYLGWWTLAQVPWPSAEHFSYVSYVKKKEVNSNLIYHSENCLIGAINSANGEANKVQNQLTGEWDGVPQVAAKYRDQGIKWVVIGDSNYGEGSSREHAALEPRFLGGLAIITRSFARIHETNLKKQGMLALTFVNPEDYEKITPDDRVDILGLDSFAPGKNLTLVAKHPDGSKTVSIFVSLAHEGVY